MKKLFATISNQIKHFFLNPFWFSKATLPLIILAVILNGLIWYLYLRHYKSLIGIVPIGYSSAVIVLNIFLANITFRKEVLASIVLLGIGLSVQLIYLIFLKFFAMSQAF